jgi:hypothetical protein
MAETEIGAMPKRIDAPNINQEPIRYDERIRKTAGATAMGKEIPNNGALKISDAE